jgi:hypothetical protein
MLLVGSVAGSRSGPVAIANSSVVGQTGNMQTAVVAQRVRDKCQILNKRLLIIMPIKLRSESLQIYPQWI